MRGRVLRLPCEEIVIVVGNIVETSWSTVRGLLVRALFVTPFTLYSIVVGISSSEVSSAGKGTYRPCVQRILFGVMASRTV